MRSQYNRLNDLLTKASEAHANLESWTREAIASHGDTTPGQREVLREHILEAADKSQAAHSQLWIELGLFVPSDFASAQRDAYKS